MKGRVLMNTSLLIITDNLDSENSLKRRLTNEGYQVQIAAFSDSRPLLLPHGSDLVVLDLTLPDSGGIRVCRTIRQLDYRGPVLMLSVHNAVADRVAGLDAGADDYLGKPFQLL